MLEEWRGEKENVMQISRKKTGQRHTQKNKEKSCKNSEQKNKKNQNWKPNTKFRMQHFISLQFSSERKKQFHGTYTAEIDACLRVSIIV